MTREATSSDLGSTTRSFTYQGNQLTQLTDASGTQNYYYDTEGNLDCIARPGTPPEICDAEDIIHLATGGLMAYAGLTQRDNELARMVVGGLGVVYLLVGILGFFATNLFGLLPHGYSLFDNLLHVALGILGMVIAWRLLPTTPR